MNIILADDQRLYRDALAHYIETAEPDARMILADDFNGVMDVLSGAGRADLLIADSALPGISGLNGLRRIHDVSPETPLALLSENTGCYDRDEACAIGLKGIFPKAISGKNMLQAIYKILQGESLLAPDQDETFTALHSDAPDIRPNRAIRLTPREKQVLEFLMRGISNKDIAEALGLQLVTVKLHVRGICRKLGARNRIQAALLAQRNGVFLS